MRQIQKGATDQSVVIRIIDATDGTPETGVVAATSGLDLKYRREGAAVVSLTESDLSALTDSHTDGGILHIGGGYYRVDSPDAAFASGVDGVLFFGTVTGMVVIGCYVSLVDFALAGQSAIDLKDFADDGYDPSTNKVQGVVTTDTATAVTTVNGLAAAVITAASIASDAITDAKVASDVTIASVMGAVGSVTGNVGGNVVGSIGSLATQAKADVNAEADTALSDVGVTTTVTGRIDAAISTRATPAQVNTEVDTALVDIGLDHLVSASVSGTDITDNSIIAKMVSKSATADWDSFVNTTDALEALRDRGDAAWITATGFSTHSASDVWAVATRVLTAATNITSTGGTITVSSGSVAVYDFTTAAKALLQAEAEDAIVTHRLDELLNADSDIDGAAPPTVGSVFHELMTKTSGSFTFDQSTDSLEALRDRGDAAWTTATGFSTLDAAGVRSAVGLASANLDTQFDALPTNAELATALAAADDAVLAAIATVQADTDNIQTRIPAALSTDGYMKADVRALNDVEESAQKIERSASAIFLGSVTASPTTTTFIDSTLTGADSGHWIGSIIVWLTGALAGQKTDITGFNSSTKQLTFTALTSAPTIGDTYEIN